MRQRKIIPGVDPKLLIKDAGKLMPDPMRRSFLRGAASLGALTFPHRLRHHRQRRRRRRAAQDFRIQRWRAGRVVQQNQARARFPRERDHQAVPVQRLLRRGRSAGGRGQELQARSRRSGRQQEVVDARRALRAAAGLADHAARLRRRLERHRLLAGRASCRNSSSASAPTRAPNTSGSNAPRATPTPSTCRPRCIRRRR